MLWSKKCKYHSEPFQKEAELELAIHEVKDDLFGASRIYLDVKKRIGAKGRKQNIPDGYLIDLTSVSEPSLYVVENELCGHHPLRHIAVQILEFSLSYQTSAARVKEILKDALKASKLEMKRCEEYVARTKFDNVDHLLDAIVHKQDSFQALVIIDELDEDLEKVLMDQFQFPVEILTLRRYKTGKRERIYDFNPLLQELIDNSEDDAPRSSNLAELDFSELDTVIIPAREEGFKTVFLGENRWYKIRISSSMIPKLKYIAGYQVAPVSAITHVAKIQSIEAWQDTGKYVLNFTSRAKKIKPLVLPAGQNGLQIQGPRYTSHDRLMNAKSFVDAF